MNLTDFTFSLSKTQYDVYKYKLDDEISYNRRKVYRYKVSDKVYNLRTEDNYKYLIKVEVSEKAWESFKKDDSWEYLVTSLNLLDVIVDHLNGFLKMNSFKEVILPEELEDLVDFKLDPESTKTLNITWFNKLKTKVKDTLTLVIFNN
jgi:hypothetical protein